MKKEYETDEHDIKQQDDTNLRKTNSSKFKNRSKREDPVTATGFSSEAELKFQRRIQSQEVLDQPTDSQPQGRKFFIGSDFKSRTLWTVIMILGFFLFISMGHVYCSLLVLVIIALIFKELIDLQKYKERNLEIRNYYRISWLEFWICTYFFTFRVLKDKLSLHKFAIFQILLRHHTLICFMLAFLVMTYFFNSLTKGYLRYQFRSFAYVSILSIMLGISASMIISNIFNGLIWFAIPCGLVICNDVSAYIYGRLLGRTQLTEISPRKTVEGFVGAIFSTLLYSIVVCAFYLGV